MLRANARAMEAFFQAGYPEMRRCDLMITFGVYGTIICASAPQPLWRG
jgi:hypothetical protein